MFTFSLLNRPERFIRPLAWVSAAFAVAACSSANAGPPGLSAALEKPPCPGQEMVGYVVPANHTKEQAIAVYRAAEIDVEQPGFVEIDPAEIEVLNRRDVMRLFQRSYPPALKSQRRGGRVVVAALVGADGSVAESTVVGPSGLRALDTAALEVAHGMKFRPGVAGGCRLPVWLFMPLTFQTD